MRAVTRLNDTGALPEVFHAVRATVLALVRPVRIVLEHATRLRAIDAECRDRLVSALAEVTAAERESGKLAAAGQLTAALRVLTEVAMPVPEDGVPGEAARHDLDDQTAILRGVAVDNRAVLVDWCREALDRGAGRGARRYARCGCSCSPVRSCSGSRRS